MSTELAPVRHFASIDSTNLEARRMADAGERGALWIVADEQTAGRGRLGRQWQSQVGNLYSTYLFAPVAEIGSLPQLGFVTALAVAQAVEQLTGASIVQHKWPNDCLIGGAKIAGILSEIVGNGCVAIGCGINVASAPQGLTYPATTLQQALGQNLTVSAVFESYAASMATSLQLWNNGSGFDAIAAAWSARAIGLGEQVSVIQGDVPVDGTMRGIGPSGALLLEEASGKILSIHAGDLQIPSLAAMRMSRHENKA